MSYVKHTWINGEVITADKLCHMEDGLDCLANCSCIWQNENPTSAFAAQEITVNTDIYATLEFYFLIDDNDTWQNICIKINKNRCFAVDGKICFPVKYGNYERFTTIEAGKIVFTDCKYGVSYNAKLIPYSIHAFE